MNFDPDFDPTNFDPTEYGEGDEPIPEGAIIARVVGFSRAETAAGDSRIDFRVEGILDENHERLDGYAPVFETVTLTRKAIWRMGNLCKAVGQTARFNLSSDMELSEAIQNKPFKCRVYHDDWNGRVRAKLDTYLTLTDEDKNAVGAVGDGGGHSKNVDDEQQIAGSMASDSPLGSAPPIDDDDIPF